MVFLLYFWSNFHEMKIMISKSTKKEQTFQVLRVLFHWEPVIVTSDALEYVLLR